MSSQEKNVSALMRMADDIQFRAQASREELATWANSIRSLAAAISNDSRTPPAGDAGAVAWQYRYVLKDVGYFTGWAHASSEGELANTVNHYTENGYTIEYRPLYTHPPSTPPYPPSTRENEVGEQELLPCPFCGAAPRLVDLAGWEVLCDCGLAFEANPIVAGGGAVHLHEAVNGSDPAPTIAAWNHRSPTPPAAGGEPFQPVYLHPNGPLPDGQQWFRVTGKRTPLEQSVTVEKIEPGAAAAGGEMVPRDSEFASLLDEYDAKQGYVSLHSTDRYCDLSKERAEIAKLRERLMLAAAPQQSAQGGWLAELGELIRTQDNRITSHPLFAVQQRRRLWGLVDGYATAFAWVDTDGEVTDDETLESLEDYFKKTGNDERGDYRYLGYIDQWEFVTACLTEQGCKDYLRLDGHNLGETRIYAYSGFRNMEWQRLREWLSALPLPPGEGVR